MRDDHRRRARIERPQTAEQLGLAVGVERRGRLIEDQQARRAKHGPGDREPLPLAARQLASAVTDALVETIGKGAHALGEARQLERFPQRLFIDIGAFGEKLPRTLSSNTDPS